MGHNEIKSDFDRDGFVVIRQFLPDDEFSELCRQLQRYITTVVPSLPDTEAFYDDKARPETLKQLSRLERDALLGEYCNKPRWRNLAESLLGEEVQARGVEWFNKPPGTHHPTPAHQDNFYFNLVPANVLTLWLALEAVDEQNGCLRYVRGSHLAGKRPHAPSNVLGFSQGITDYGPEDTMRETAMILKANDLSVHHGWTIHRADANRSATRHRPAFAIVFQGVSCKVDRDGHARYVTSLQDQHRLLGL